MKRNLRYIGEYSVKQAKKVRACDMYPPDCGTAPTGANSAVA